MFTSTWVLAWTISYGTRTIFVHKKLKLDKRRGSDNWYVRITLDNGKRIVKTTKTEDLDVAGHAIRRMQAELDEGVGKQAYRDYNSALRRWLFPYFADTDVAKIDLAALKAFDAWRTERNKKPFSQSGINNHNAALNRMPDEAELNGCIAKAMRPTQLNKGAKSESWSSFTDAQYKKIYTALRTWHKKTNKPKSAATREVLRNYVLFLANSGVRHGTEALGLRWRDITWQENEDERYLIVNVEGKTNKVLTHPTVRGPSHFSRIIVSPNRKISCELKGRGADFSIEQQQTQPLQLHIFKRTQLGQNWPHFLSLPYYRFEVTSQRTSEQHSLLLALDAWEPHTFSAAPAFHTNDEIKA